MTILIVGAGGNGHTYFMNFLKENGLKTNNKDDEDGFKHLNYPDENKIKEINAEKCIFIYNNPFLSILSHFNRKWQFCQIQKLGNPYKLKINQVENLDNFLKLTEQHKCDIFGIKFQFDNWIINNLKIPVLFLDFNDILKEKDKINKFIGKDLNYNKFTIKERKSVITYKYKTIYDKIYSDLYNYIKIKSVDYNNNNII